MNLVQHIVIQVNVPRPETEGDRLYRAAKNLGDQVQRGINNHIAHEQSRGNPLFANIATHKQYLEACEADRRRQRKELGFWRYYFGG